MRRFKRTGYVDRAIAADDHPTIQTIQGRRPQFGQYVTQTIRENRVNGPSNRAIATIEEAEQFIPKPNPLVS